MSYVEAQYLGTGSFEGVNHKANALSPRATPCEFVSDSIASVWNYDRSTP